MRRLAILALLFLAACSHVREQPAPPPHASHAWARFDAQRITASGAHGLADRESGRGLTIGDPVRIASVSKLVVALGVMRLVEQGRLDLDADVSQALGWTLRNPAFPETPITLRLLLSHKSSLRDEVDYALPLGADMRTALAAPAAFDPKHRPGTYFRYSNLNFPVIATVMERATDERFDLLMQRLVLAPLGLDACFNWPTCSDAAVARAAVLYGADGAALRDDLKGARPACPVVPAADGGCAWQAYRPGTNGALFSPQGGLRVSVEGLSVIGRLLLNKGKHRRARFLSEASIGAMLEPEWIFDGRNGDSEGGFYCGYGLAVQLLAHCPPGDDLLGEHRRFGGHAGDAYGLRSGLWIDPATRTGIAYFATGVADDAPKGRTAYPVIEEWMAARALRGLSGPISTPPR
jgi:CubicO group peptidase (beta-lactamase class C family)